MDWAREKSRWPNADNSKFVNVGGTRIHVQIIGDGPDVLLLHGTGATTHSFSEMVPFLAGNFRLIIPDLPGHGFSHSLNGKRASLENVSSCLTGLLEHLESNPVAIVGHSAGAAIGVAMIKQTGSGVKCLISINGAFYPFPGFAGDLFPAMARLLFLNPFVPKFFAYGASSRERVKRLIDSTGSKLSSEQLDFYQRAFSSSDHVEGTLAMMANWNLNDMKSMLQLLDLPVLQIIGENDGTIDPSVSEKTNKLLSFVEKCGFEGKGHLVHEESPKEVAEVILEFVCKNISGDDAKGCVK